MEGSIFDIQRFSLHDGPGIRTTVFMKGCPLRCSWCHNPESISPKPLLSFIPGKCIGCGTCFENCPAVAHENSDGQHVIDRSKCSVCGKCTEECYSKALETVGRTESVDEVMKEVLADKLFYENSEGGMTLSGGEPTQQFDFTLELLKRAKEEGLHTAVETCSFCKYEKLEHLAEYTDLFLCDFKETNPEKHKEFTGVDNNLIIENIIKLHDAGNKVLLRCPIIPTLNDRDEHFKGIADLYHKMPECEGVEIMPYHRLGEGKLHRLGDDLHGGGSYDTPEADTVSEWKGKLVQYGVKLL